MMTMDDWQPKAYPGYKWIVRDPELLAGKPAVRDTRLSVAFLLRCIAEGMSPQEIQQTYGTFPEEAIPEILMLAAHLVDSEDVAACIR